MYCLIELTFFLIIYLHANICQQVQDIEFMQIEMQVIEGLKVGNDCLKSMHEVDVLLCLLFFFYSYLLCLEISLSHLCDSNTSLALCM